MLKNKIWNFVILHGICWTIIIWVIFFGQNQTLQAAPLQQNAPAPFFASYLL